MQFAQPAQPGQFKVADYVGRLVLISVHSVEKAVKTAFGEADAIKADVVVLDGPDAPIEVENALIFGRALVSSLEPLAGQQSLGRIGQGVAKQGQSAPWLLNQHTAPDVQIANAYIAQKLQAGVQQPAAAPAPAPVPNPAATYLANTPVGMPAAQAAVAAQPLPVIPGMTPEQVQAMVAGGADVAAISALAAQLGAAPVAS